MLARQPAGGALAAVPLAGGAGGDTGAPGRLPRRAAAVEAAAAAPRRGGATRWTRWAAARPPRRRGAREAEATLAALANSNPAPIANGIRGPARECSPDCRGGVGPDACCARPRGRARTLRRGRRRERIRRREQRLRVVVALAPREGTAASRAPGTSAGALARVAEESPARRDRGPASSETRALESPGRAQASGALRQVSPSRAGGDRAARSAAAPAAGRRAQHQVHVLDQALLRPVRPPARAVLSRSRTSRTCRAAAARGCGRLRGRHVRAAGTEGGPPRSGEDVLLAAT